MDRQHRLTIMRLINAASLQNATDAAAAAALNVQSIELHRPIGSDELLAWAGAAGRLARFKAAEASSNQSIASAAEAARIMILRDNTALDPFEPTRAALIDGLVAAGVLTAEERADLRARATYYVSPAEQAGIAPVGSEQVKRARMGDFA